MDNAYMHAILRQGNRQRRDYPNPPEEIDDPSTLKGCTKTQCLVGTAFFFVFLIATAVLAIVVNNKFSLLLIGVFFLLIYLARRFFKNENRRVRCTLCKEEMPFSDFKEHGLECERRDKERIAALPGLAGVACGLCSKVLALQPVKPAPDTLSGVYSRANEFWCQAGNPLCPRKDEATGEPFKFENNGKNRFGCPDCQFDMCYDCVARRVEQQQQQQQQFTSMSVEEVEAAPATKVVRVEPPAYDDVINQSKG